MTDSFEWAMDPTPLSEITPAFTLPEEMRPRASPLAPVPTIDLLQAEGILAETVSRACQEHGFFQVINHGVPQELCTGILNALKDLFQMPPHAKAGLFSDDPSKDVRLFSRYLKVGGCPQGKASMWSEAFYHPWHPSMDFTPLFPSTPPAYRALITEYATEISKLFTRLLSLISLGLGLDKDYLESRHGQSPRRRAQANYYPPELTLGLPPHTDLNTITLLLQSDHVPGLQVVKDGDWVNVSPTPMAFVVNVGDQLQVMSNGRCKSVHHRAVVNKHELRVSMAMFFGPDLETTVAPAEGLVGEGSPRVYRSYRYKEFVEEFHRQEGTRRRVKEVFEL